MKRNMARRIIAATFFILGVFQSAGISYASVFQTSTSVAGEQYANEPGPGSRLDLNASLVSDLDSEGEKQFALPRREIHFYSFYESGPNGDYSLDIDRTVQRFFFSDQGHAWIGRTHPLAEATLKDYPLPTDAIGANWAQNQSDAVNPRVSGWFGLGGRYENPNKKFSVTTAFSPLFLPSFGPRLQLSETSAAHGSRFSRLPPQFVEQGNSTLPLRYSLHVGDIRSIIFQPQAYLSAGYANEDMRVDFLDWTAPNPSADVDTDYALVIHTSGAVSDDSADVVVDARPKFRRQHFTGMRYDGMNIPFRPLFAATYEWFKKEVTASLSVVPTQALTLGAMNKWSLREKDNSPTAALSPSYSDSLAWFEAATSFLEERLKTSLRCEQHLSTQNFGRLIRPKAIYRVTRTMNLFAMAQIMSGKDRSYYGEWRSLGSAVMGVNWQW